MSSYRFCRTDDIGLLVDALNHCWAPNVPDEPPATPASFKRSIRNLQVWCSSCMVAFSGSEPIGVLIGAKRPSGTLVHRIAVHPDHRRQGHGRHLLDSLRSKLAILGPPRIVAEVPETNTDACALFRAAGYVEEAVLTDYVLEEGAQSRDERASLNSASRMVIPVTIDDLAANDVLGGNHSQTCWERAVETLSARKDDISGFAVASEERLEAWLLYIKDGTRTDILALRSLSGSAPAAHLAQLLAQLWARGIGTVRFPKVHPAEVPREHLESLGFRPAGTHRLYVTRARAG